MLESNVRYNSLVDDLSSRIFAVRNDLTEYMREKGGAKVSGDYKHFKESTTYEGIIKALEVMEKESVGKLKTIDPSDHVLIAKLQMTASFKDAFIAMIERLASEATEQESFGAAPQNMMV